MALRIQDTTAALPSNQEEFAHVRLNVARLASVSGTVCLTVGDGALKSTDTATPRALQTQTYTISNAVFAFTPLALVLILNRNRTSGKS